MKKPYTKMALTCEAFELNEAIAACAVVSPVGTYKCNDCYTTNRPNQTTHLFDVYILDGLYYGVSVTDADANSTCMSGIHSGGVHTGDVFLAHKQNQTPGTNPIAQTDPRNPDSWTADVVDAEGTSPLPDGFSLILAGAGLTPTVYNMKS